MSDGDATRGDGGTTVEHPTANAPTASTSDEPASPKELLVGPDADVTPVLSVVMPTMNEEAGIETCLDWIEDAIQTLGVPTEIIVSDSSTDQTATIARRRGARVLTPDEEGYGYAYRYAFQRARGEYIVMGDADTTYDFSEIPRLFEELRDSGADMVMGSRLAGEIESGAMPPLHQYIGNPLLTRFLNGFYGTDVSDAHSGFRLFRRELVEELALETTGMEFASEMIMAAGAQGYEITEVPIVYHERKGEETLDSFRDGWRHVRFMLLNAPGYLFSIPGLLVGCFGVMIMAVAATDMTINGVSLGVNSMVAGSLLTIAGYQIGSLGIFAAVSSDPVQAPSDSVTRFVTERVSLEHGATIGSVILLAGTAGAGSLISKWVASGFVGVGFTIYGLLSFTGIVLGLQTIFYSFFLSVLADR